MGRSSRKKTNSRAKVRQRRRLQAVAYTHPRVPSEAGMHDLTEFENTYHRCDLLILSPTDTVKLTMIALDTFCEHTQYERQDEEGVSRG